MIKLKRNEKKFTKRDKAIIIQGFITTILHSNKYNYNKEFFSHQFSFAIQRINFTF